jgi:hypothetical protein
MELDRRAAALQSGVDVGPGYSAARTNKFPDLAKRWARRRAGNRGAGRSLLRSWYRMLRCGDILVVDDCRGALAPA